jgi:hypothetical protein
VKPLTTIAGTQLEFARQYTKAAAVVTLHDGVDNTGLASDPVERDANVTARVTYAYHCTVPVVRVLMCRSIETLAKANPLMSRAANALPALVNVDARYKLLVAAATLPNQGGRYYSEVVK